MKEIELNLYKIELEANKTFVLPVHPADYPKSNRSSVGSREDVEDLPWLISQMTFILSPTNRFPDHLKKVISQWINRTIRVVCCICETVHLTCRTYMLITIHSLNPHHKEHKQNPQHTSPSLHHLGILGSCIHCGGGCCPVV
jgi:hypothetical protein